MPRPVPRELNAMFRGFAFVETGNFFYECALHALARLQPLSSIGLDVATLHILRGDVEKQTWSGSKQCREEDSQITYR